VPGPDQDRRGLLTYDVRYMNDSNFSGHTARYGGFCNEYRASLDSNMFGGNSAVMRIAGRAVPR
jgi:hypothetical protein